MLLGTLYISSYVIRKFRFIHWIWIRKNNNNNSIDYASSLCNGGGILFSSLQLIFHFGRRVIAISFERSFRVHSKIDSVCLYHDL